MLAAQAPMVAKCPRLPRRLPAVTYHEETRMVMLALGWSLIGQRDERPFWPVQSFLGQCPEGFWLPDLDVGVREVAVDQPVAVLAEILPGN